MRKFIFKIISSFILLIFTINTVLPVPVYAQSLNLPAVGQMVMPTPQYAPAIVKGIKIFPDNPLRFDFIVDTGDSGLEGDALKEESEKLIKYFLASLTTPEEDIWVNLSPYEKDRIIPNSFGMTEMGRDLLAQDYILKQLTASLMYPEDELGETFWDAIFEKAYEQFGTTDIPINTFNKVWIMPEKAVVYENEDTAFVVESRLKVMLEEDYLAYRQAGLAMEKNNVGANGIRPNQILSNKGRSPIAPTRNNFQTQIIRNVILPAIEKEVNQGKHFAQLRQIYHALILATWFKMNLKESLLGKIYVDQNKIAGVDIEDKQVKDKIYNQYLDAFKEGVYDYIRDDFEPATQQIIPRKYFSGGVVGRLGLNVAGSPVLIVINKISESRISSLRKKIKNVFRLGVNLKNNIWSRAFGKAPRISYMQTTSRYRNIDIYRNVFQKKSFLKMLEEKGIYLSEGLHKIMNIGIGGVPFDTLQMNDEIKKFNNPEIVVFGTELPQVLAQAHVMSESLLEEFRGEILSILAKDYNPDESLTKEAIFDLRLVVTKNGHSDQVGISEALVGVEYEDGRSFYYTIAMNKSIQYVMFDKKVSGDRSELLDRFIEFLGKDNVERSLRKDSSKISDIVVEFDPMLKAFKDVGVSFVSTEELGKSIKDVSIMTANHVVVHMTEEEKDMFMNKANQSLREGGVILIKTTEHVREDEVGRINIYQKISGRLVYQGSLTSNVYDGSLFNEANFIIHRELFAHNAAIDYIIKLASQLEIKASADLVEENHQEFDGIINATRKGIRYFGDLEERQVSFLQVKKVDELHLQDSTFMWKWDNALEVPWGEVIHDLAEQPEPKTDNEKSLWKNQVYVRELFLEMSQEFRRGNISEVFKFIEYLEGMNIGLLLGKDDDTVYKTPQVALFKSIGRSQIKVKAGRIIGTKEQLGKLYSLFQILIQDFTEKDLSQKEVIHHIAEFYYYAIFIISYPFETGSNSVFMNIVNGILRLHGLNGMSHNYFDRKGPHLLNGRLVDGSKLKFQNYFEEKVLELNLSKKRVGSPVGVSRLGEKVGGIDFNPNNLNLETQGKGINYNAPIDPQLLESLTSSPIEGFSPVIFNITPITNLPALLGLNDQNEEPFEGDLSYRKILFDRKIKISLSVA